MRELLIPKALEFVYMLVTVGSIFLFFVIYMIFPSQKTKETLVRIWLIISAVMFIILYISLFI